MISLKGLATKLRDVSQDKDVQLRLRIFLVIAKFMRDPSKTEFVFDLDDLLFELHGEDAFLKPLLADHAASLVIRDRKLLGPIDLSKLAALPEGTLGERYGNHMLSRNLKPDFYRTKAAETDIGFVVTRIRQAHDLWHVVNEYDTEMLGEMSLQAFSIAYLQIPTAMLLVGAQLIRTALFETADMRTLSAQLATAFTRGQSVKGLFAYDWESNWHKPLQDVRAELNLSV